MKKIYYLAAWLLLTALHPLAAQNYQQVQKLTASDGSNEANFGVSLSVSGNYAVVGAPNIKVNGVNGGYIVGAAYVYEKTSTGWKQVQKLKTSTDDVAEPDFGSTTSIDGNQMMIGAHNETLMGSSGNYDKFFYGAVYVFEKTSGGWTEVDKLTPDDHPISFAHFGGSIALSGNRAVIGAFGEHAVYFFEKNASGWQKVNKFSNYTDFYNGTFGLSVALSGDYAVVGYPSSSSKGTYAGAAYLYQRTSTGWKEIQQLYATDAKENANFGFSVAMNDSYVVIGTRSGEVYVFKKSSNGWTQTQKLTHSNSKSNDGFGTRIHLSNNEMMVGAQYNSSAYIYEKTSGGWKEKGRLSEPSGNLGRSVFISNGQYFAGAPGDDTKATNAGAVYVYKEAEITSQQSIARFSLVNAKTDQVIPAYADLQEGSVINLSNTGLSGSDKYNQLNIEAVTNPSTVGSVKFILKGPASLAPVDNSVPYAIFSDYRGDYKAGSLPVGSYTLTAIPFSEAKRSGTEGTRKTIHFTIVDGAVEEPTQPEEPGNDVLAVVRFSLINAKTDQVIAAYADLQEGAVVNLANTGLSGSDKYSQLNIEAITNPSTVGSVKFILRGPVSTAPVEGGAPYAIFGDNNGNYEGGSLPVGNYTLTAIPYSEAKKAGVEGEGKSIHFSVVDGQAAQAARIEDATKSGKGNQQQAAWGREVPQVFHLYPNPATDKLQLAYRGESGEELLLSVYNAAGQLIRQKTAVSVLEEEMDLSEQPPGIYMAVLLHNGKQLTQKFMVAR